jgi:hypothetical protein
MHDDRDPAEKYRAPARKPNAGGFHQPVHRVVVKRANKPAGVRLSAPITRKRKPGDRLRMVFVLCAKSGQGS